MKRLLVMAVAIASLFALGGVAQAQDPPESTVPEEFVPPAPGPVTDTATAAAFTERYVSRAARRLVRQSGRRVRVLDANAVCLEHPAIAARFGCVFTLRVAIFNRRDRHRGHDRYEPASRRGDDRRSRNRVRTYGCLGALRVIGGEGVTPTGSLRFVECARVRNQDYEAPEVEPVS